MSQSREDSIDYQKTGDRVNVAITTDSIVLERDRKNGDREII